MIDRRIIIGFCAAWWFMAASAEGHKPIFSDGTANNAESAIVIDDISISYVVYHEATEQAGELWITFQGQAGQ